MVSRRRAAERGDERPMFAQRAVSEGMAQGREELSLLPERAPSEGPRSTAAVESSSRPCIVDIDNGAENANGTRAVRRPWPRSA